LAYHSICRQETLLLDVLDARHVRKDAAYLAEKIGVLAARIGPENLACITTDGASSCLAAQNLLRNDPALALSGRTGLLRCAEHMGNLIAGDVLGAVPWAQKLSDEVHKACRMLRKHKRLHALVRQRLEEAVAAKELQAYRRIRIIRRTRFCSVHAMFQAHLANRPVLQRITGDAAWKDIVNSNSEKKKQRLARMEKTFSKVPFWATSSAGVTVHPKGCRRRLRGVRAGLAAAHKDAPRDHRDRGLRGQGG